MDAGWDEINFGSVTLKILKKPETSNGRKYMTDDASNYILEIYFAKYIF